ncbi:MAG: peroxiredoxin [bacterium]|jgi:peroxiredoxin (alkyl hydroperoxide reductase subunit C)|nr:peroxiredoxin [candidate division KSB1 bacterium]MDH7559766.1 peroxiredoxin [bacterium]
MEGRMPLIGDPVPEFEAQTTKGYIHFPKDYAGKWVILFSHPADYTPVCTTEFVGFAKRHETFKALNAELLGLSIDQIFSHIKWTEWIKERLNIEIPFPIIADNTGAIAQKLGMLHTVGGGTQTVRAVFFIDPKGIIRAMLYYPLSNGRNMDEIVRLLKALQTTDQHKVATPADWPNNELIGDKVIVPPPTSEQEIAARKGMYECYDWWFCYKPLP